MIRRWISLLSAVVAAVALVGLTACHKKETPPQGESRAVEQATGQEPAAAVESTEKAGEPAEEAGEAGPPPTPPAEGPVSYAAGEEAVLIAGAHVTEKTREPGHWHVAYTVDTTPQRVLTFYRQEAGKRGWTEKSTQSMGPGGFITWATAHGELQMIVGRSPAGGSSVDLNWNQNQ